jgi:ligand-binding sensor domain-containing protein
VRVAKPQRFIRPLRLAATTLQNAFYGPTGSKMKRTFLDSIVIIFLLSASMAISQTWKSYTSTQEARVLLDDGTYLWIGTTGGLIKFDKINETHRLYTKDSGLSSNTIQCLHKDVRDNLWVGTNNGLSMFDGSMWATYFTENSDLPISNIRAIAGDPYGDIVIAGGEMPAPVDRRYFGPTHARLYDGRWESPDSSEFLKWDAPAGFCLDVAESDEFLCGTNYGLYFVGLNEWAKLNIPTSENNPKGPWIFDLTFDASKNIKWIATDYGLYTIQGVFIEQILDDTVDFESIAIEESDILWLVQRFKKGFVKKYDHGVVSSLSLRAEAVYDVIVDEEKTVWFAHSNGVSKKSGTDIKNYEFDSELKSPSVTNVNVDSKGNLWFIIPDKIGHFNGVKWSYFEPPHRYPVTKIYIDSKDRIWAFGGSARREVYYFENNAWTQFAKGEQLNCIAENQNGDMWFGGSNHLLFRLNSDLQNRQDFGDKINDYSSRGLTALLVDESRNDLWIGISEGILRLDLYDYSIQYWDDYLDRNLPSDIKEIRQRDDGTIWAASNSEGQGGLSYFQDNEWIRAPIDEWGCEASYINDLEIDAEGRVWFSMNGVSPYEEPEGGIGMFDGQNWHQYEMHNSGLVENAVTNIAMDKNGDLWISSIGGISQFTPRQSSTGFDELQNTTPCNYVPSSNYPNPFNPSTTISFDQPEDDFVTLKIYDISGRLVRVLMQEHKLAGEHSILWDGLDDAGQKVAAGVYLYRIEVVDAVGERVVKMWKMSLVK